MKTFKKGFWLIIVLLLMVLKSCAYPPTISSEKKLLHGLNEIVGDRNNAISGFFPSSGTEFSGNFSIVDSDQASGSLIFSGNFYGNQRLEAGNLDFEFRERDYEQFKFIDFDGNFLFVLDSLSLYLYPHDFSISFGEGNIQTKFIQLLTQGLKESWLKIDTPKILVQTPQLQTIVFSGSLLSGDELNFATFDTLLGSFGVRYHLEHLSGHLKRKKLTISEMTFQKGGSEFSFSGELKRKQIKGTIFNKTQDSYVDFTLKRKGGGGLELKINLGPQNFLILFSGNNVGEKYYQILWEKGQNNAKMEFQLDLKKGNVLDPLSIPEEALDLLEYLENAGLLDEVE